MSSARRGTRQFADGGGASSDPVNALNRRTMDLKGVGSVEALGKLMKVEYDEGGPSPVPYIGLVVYTESSRRGQPPWLCTPPQPSLDALPAVAHRLFCSLPRP